MPTTRAARRAAAERALLELPADLLGLVLYQLPLAHDIALTGRTCRTLCEAAKLALKLRPFSGVVVTLVDHTDDAPSPHTDDVTRVLPCRDGRIVTTSRDQTIKVWRDGVCERTIDAHSEDIDGAALLPCGTRFISGSDDGSAKLWNIDGSLERTFRMVGAVELCQVRSVVAMPDGEHFVVGLSNGCLRLYHVDGTLAYAFEGHADFVYDLVLTPDGQHIISGSGDQLVKVWSVATKSLLSTCRGHTHWILAVAAMPDGQRILSGSTDATVRVWLLDGTLKNTFELHAKWVNALVALPDNQHALSASADRTVKLFNVNDGAVLRTFKHHRLDVTSLALLPDGLRFVSGSFGGKAYIVEHGLAPVRA
jgi:WD40 repeat protein